MIERKVIPPEKIRLREEKAVIKKNKKQKLHTLYFLRIVSTFI